jgi:hypothetical protein
VRGYFWKNHKRSINDNFSFAWTRHIFDSQKLTKKFCAKTLFASLPFLFASLCFRFASLYSILKIKFALFASLRFFVRFAFWENKIFRFASLSQFCFGRYLYACPTPVVFFKIIFILLTRKINNTILFSKYFVGFDTLTHGCLLTSFGTLVKDAHLVSNVKISFLYKYQ